MNSAEYWLRTLLAGLVLLCPSSGTILSVPDASPASSCAAAKYHEFDFWLGDWDVFEIDSGAKDAHVRVDRILDGCALRERYEGINGHKGLSFSVYDRTRDLWHQSWVTNRGELLMIEGKFQGGEMGLSGSDLTSSGEERRIRGVWKPMGNEVRETAVTSTDGGRTWKPWFDLVFHKASSQSRSTDAAATEERTIAALDTEYQASVKRNDATIMDRLLGENFALVTGSGKNYTKLDLLEEARSGRQVYEHQEDSEQRVRVWGDTAVLTAKLWEKGTDRGKPFDRTLWFSDTYIRTPAGWRYVLGQSSLPLPRNPQ